MDEISMVDCLDFYKICAKMCVALRNDGTPFGGINMIVAGDFAQLPPTTGTPLYSHTVARVIHRTASHENQMRSIGKALWHQFTTVVILRQNMRQKTQTPEDAKLRTALENLRYKSCTGEDIELLQSRVAGTGQGRPKLNDSRFKYVSIITRWNAARDKINMEASKKFAIEHGQELVDFYSVDRLGGKSDDSVPKKQRKRMVNPLRKRNIVSDELQDLLWSLDPQMTEHHAGKLSLCIGMPVMIKQNEATECCVTNGAEAEVVGWTSKPINEEKNMLDTLFVRLTSAPRPIKLPGLPENVVPLPCREQVIKCRLPDKKLLTITRTQVAVLPNFAMTDFASQGRTRPFNVCDIQNSKSHQSIYTCLSRGSTVEGTVIAQPFDPSKVVGGISGSLRQEFRELELLNQITKMRWNETISSKVTGITRNELIHAFRQWRGESFVPPNIHSALSWGEFDPFPIENPQEDAGWELLASAKDGMKPMKNPPPDEFPNKNNNGLSTGYVVAQGTQTLKFVGTYTPKPIVKCKVDDQNEKTQGPRGQGAGDRLLACPFKGML